MEKERMGQWLAFTNQHQAIEARLEQALKAESNLSLNEYYVLYYLEKTPNHSMRLNDLIAHFDLSQSAMSRMIMRMDDKLCGVIERHSCQDDKRGIYIDLTQSGEKKLQRSKVVFEKVLEEMLD